jgi:hypothetical protein
MMTILTLLLNRLPQRSTAFVADAPAGIGLEWMTIAAVVVPALVLVGLVYAGAQQTV